MVHIIQEKAFSTFFSAKTTPNAYVSIDWWAGKGAARTPDTYQPPTRQQYQAVNGVAQHS